MRLWKAMTPAVNTIASIPNTANSIDGLTYFIMKVAMNREQMKNIIAKILYCCESTSALCSSIPSAINTLVPYCIMKVQHII